MLAPSHPHYKIQEYFEGLEEEITNLLIQGYDGWPKIDINCSAVDYWQWKYLENPTGKINLHVVMDGARVICCDHGQPHRIKIGENVRLCSCRGDLTVDIEYRGKGVWSYSNEYATYTERRDGIELVYYLTGNETIINRMSKIRPQFPRLTNWFLLKDVKKHLDQMPVEREWLVKAGSTALKTINRIMKKPDKRRPDFKITHIQTFSDDIDVFWDEVSPDYSFIVERKKDYLNWRYADSRAGKHIIYAAYRENKLLGYIVIRINRYLEEYPVGFIVDLLTLPQENNVAGELIREAVGYFNEQKINLVNCLMIKGSRYEKSLRENSFLDSRINIHMFYQADEIEEEIKIVSGKRVGNLHFTWGDHDSLPIAVSKT